MPLRPKSFGPRFLENVLKDTVFAKSVVGRKGALVAGGLALLLAVACTPTEQNAALGAAGGAVLGAAVSGKGDRDKGAVVGGALGAMAGAMIGQASSPGQCYYNDGFGGRYVAPC